MSSRRKWNFPRSGAFGSGLAAVGGKRAASQRWPAVALVATILGAAAPSTVLGQGLAAVPLGNFVNPTYVAVAPNAKRLLFVVERPGRIRVLRDETLIAKPFLDIRNIVKALPDAGADGEHGLFSIAFPPDYAKTRRFYVAFTNSKDQIEINEFRRSKDKAAQAVKSSRRVVLKISHPDSISHFGGQLEFGPEGLLYISTGDGGGNPKGEPSRKLNSLLGKILRIDPRKTATAAYRIPPSNPYVGKSGRDEIFSYGLRNPWRFSFDGQRILISDVGEESREEVNVLKRGQANGTNFGWPQFEGNIVFDNARPGPDPARAPSFVYSHANGRCSITGGYIANDPDLPFYAGRYIYGDFCTGEVRSFNPNSPAATDDETQLTLPFLASFGKGHGGKLYATQIGGAVSRLEQAGSDPAVATTAQKAD